MIFSSSSDKLNKMFGDRKRKRSAIDRKPSNLHWCAKIKDEVEKLACQLNEEAERTERPIRRLSKVMYGSNMHRYAGRRNGGVSE